MPQIIIVTNLVTTSRTGIPSPTSASHVGDWSTTSASHVENQQLVATSHVGGTNIVSMSHTDITSPSLVSHAVKSSPTSVHHVGDEPPTSASHAESMSSSIVSDVGGIHTIEKPRCVRRKPKFLFGFAKEITLLACALLPLWYKKRGPCLGALQVMSCILFPNTFFLL
jgi:hypothetical protein